jgi:hypothetical protein
MTEPTLTVPNRGGRPPVMPWETLREQIAQYIAAGWGLRRLSRRYGVTPGGMRLVLSRLKLQTLRQADWQAQREPTRH